MKRVCSLNSLFWSIVIILPLFSNPFVIRTTAPRIGCHDHTNIKKNSRITRNCGDKGAGAGADVGIGADDNLTMGTTLPQYLKEKRVDEELLNIICATATACINISQELQRLPIRNYNNNYNPIQQQVDDKNEKSTKRNVQGEVQKEMDVIANDIFIDKVKETVVVMTSEEEEDIIKGVLWDSFYSNDTLSDDLAVNMEGIDDDGHDLLDGKLTSKNGYEIAFDPLDGSSNLDVNVPTGTIFGIAPHTVNRPFSSSGRCLVAAGYSVYSSSVEFVISLGQSGSDGCAGFTLDPSLLHRNSDIEPSECLVLSRLSMKCPTNGPYYSLNDGREPDWPDGLQRWIHDAKRGQTPSKTVFSSRYVCSLVADVHRTLIKGGWAGNPRPHLRLLYEASPLAHVVEACGGRGSDGVQNLLDITPRGLHDRTCVFMGSLDDVVELESYGDVQQGAKTYSS